MQQFQIDYLHTPTIMTRMYRRGFPILIAFLAIMGTVNCYRSEGKVSIEMIVSTSLILLIFILLIVVQQHGKTSRSLESFTLTFEDQLITREKFNTPTITLLRSEVTRITQDKTGAIFIFGQNSGDEIKVPAEIANRDALEKLLTQIQPILPATKKWVTAESAIVLFLLFPAMLLSEITRNKTIMLVSGVLILSAYIYHAFQVKKDRNVDYDSKRHLWFGLFWVLWILFRAYNRLLP